MPISIYEQKRRDYTKYEYDDNSSDIYYYKTNKNTEQKYKKYKDINKHQHWNEILLIILYMYMIMRVVIHSTLKLIKKLK